MANLLPILTGGNGTPTYNLGMAETYSWVPVQNDQNRPLFAQAGYIVNLSDLSISLSASDINIGGVEIVDAVNHTIRATVIQDIINGNSLQVQTQDLESSIDDVTIGDRDGNLASVVRATSSLNVNVTNFAVLTANQLITNTLLNSVTANEATAVNQVTTNSLLNALTGNNATAVNQVVTNTLLNSVTANQAVEITLQTSLTANNATTANQLITNSLLNVLTGNNATSSNQVVTNTLLNSVTANQSTQITLEKTLSANSVYGTTFNQPLYTTITSPVSNILVNAALPISFADTVQIDQAGRLRVATPNTQWWYQASVDKDGDVRYNESFVGGASSIFVQNLGSVNMTSGTTSTSGQAIRASRRRHKIIPGQSHEYAGVWNWDGQQTNVVKRIGIFTQYNGYFFELSGTDMNVVVRRRLADGTTIEERVNQSAWNGDRLDGTGSSGEDWNALTTTAAITGWVSTTAVTPQNAIPVYNVVYGLSAGQVQNFRQGTKATITGITPSTYNAVGIIAKTDTTTNRLTATYLFNPGVSASNATAGSMYQNGYHMQHTYWIDFMGGRTNRVRFGKQSDYGQIVLHTFRFDGLLGTAYENAPTLTERKEIYNIGSPTSLPSFTVMGNAFNVESQADITPNFCIARNDAGVTFANVGDEVPILGLAIRAGEPYQRADIQLNNIHVMDTANLANTNNNVAAALSWRLILNPSIQGTIPTPTNIGKASRQWAYTTANSVSGGQDLLGGYIVSKTTEDLNTQLNFINMGSNIDNTDSDKIVLVVKRLTDSTNDPKIVATMNFGEAL
jgi:hypothetical protein